MTPEGANVHLQARGVEPSSFTFLNTKIKNLSYALQDNETSYMADLNSHSSRISQWRRFDEDRSLPLQNSCLLTWGPFEDFTSNHAAWECFTMGKSKWFLPTRGWGILPQNLCQIAYTWPGLDRFSYMERGECTNYVQGNRPTPRARWWPLKPICSTIVGNMNN